MSENCTKSDEKGDMQDEAELQPLPYPETDLSPALQQKIKEKLDRGETDEVEADVFEKNLRKVLKKRD